MPRFSVISEVIPLLRFRSPGSSLIDVTFCVSVARWARVNTLLTSVEDCSAELEWLGWELVETPKSREEYVEVVKTLGDSQYVIDYDFPTLLAFPPSVNILDWVGSLVEETKLLLQDKVLHMVTKNWKFKDSS